MESKKSERADTRKWVRPLFNLGLLCAVGAVLVAFEWKIEEEKPLLDISEDKEKWEIDIIPITIQNPPTAPPPIVIPPVIKTIDDDIKIDDVFIIDNNMPENKPLVDVALLFAERFVFLDGRIKRAAVVLSGHTQTYT